MKIKFKKGWSMPTLSGFLFTLYCSLFKKQLQIKFTEKSKYTLDDTDQCDWNKIYGRVGLKYINGQRASEQLAVWRYCKGGFLIDEYYRVNGEMIMFKGVKVPLDTWVDVPKPAFINNIPASSWFGGSDSDGNNIGGKAPFDCEFELRIKK